MGVYYEAGDWADLLGPGLTPSSGRQCPRCSAGGITKHKSLRVSVNRNGNVWPTCFRCFGGSPPTLAEAIRFRDEVAEFYGIRGTGKPDHQMSPAERTSRDEQRARIKAKQAKEAEEKKRAMRNISAATMSFTLCPPAEKYLISRGYDPEGRCPRSMPVGFITRPDMKEAGGKYYGPTSSYDGRTERWAGETAGAVIWGKTAMDDVGIAVPNREWTEDKWFGTPVSMLAAEAVSSDGVRRDEIPRDGEPFLRGRKAIGTDQTSYLFQVEHPTEEVKNVVLGEGPIDAIMAYQHFPEVQIAASPVSKHFDRVDLPFDWTLWFFADPGAEADAMKGIENHRAKGGIAHLCTVPQEYEGKRDCDDDYKIDIADYLQDVGGEHKLADYAVQTEPPSASEVAELIANSVGQDKPPEITETDIEEVEEKDQWGMGYAPQAWIIEDWMPRGEVVLFTGAGGGGKSRLALQLAMALCVGAADWLPQLSTRDDISLPPAGTIERLPRANGERLRVHYAGWEESIQQIDRRAEEVAEYDRVVLDALGGKLKFTRERAALWVAHEESYTNDNGSPTRRLRKLLEDAADRDLLILDPVVAAYAGNENARAQVRAFLNHLSVWAELTDTAILIVAHPPKQTSGFASIYSGSTDWWNAPRAVWSLTMTEIAEGLGKDREVIGEAPTLRLEKSSYGRPHPSTPEVYMVGPYRYWRATTAHFAATNRNVALGRVSGYNGSVVPFADDLTSGASLTSSGEAPQLEEPF